MRTFPRAALGPLLLTLVTAALVAGDLWAPAFWDEPKVYFRPLFALATDFWGTLKTPPTLYDRPLGLHFFYLPIVKLFGDRIFLIRTLNVSFFIAGMWAFYYAVNSTRRAAVLGAWGLLLVTPISRNYIADYVCEYQLFFFIAVTLWLLEQKPHRRSWVFVAAFCAGLLRESGLVLMPVILLHGYLRRTQTWPQLLCLSLAPVLGLVPHWARNLWLTGEFFHHLTIQSGHLVWFQSFAARAQTMSGALFASYRLWPLIGLSVIFAVLGRRRLGSSASRFEACAALIVLAFVGVFSGHVVGIPRYYLAAMPFLFYLFSLTALSVTSQVRWQLLALAGLLLVSSLAGDPTVNPPGPFAHHSGLQDGGERAALREQHARAIAATKAVLTVEDEVVTSWPFYEMLRSPHLGYGPVRGRARLASVGAAPPKAILWTDFPKQIPAAQLHEWLSQARYEERDFSYRTHRVILYVRKDP